MEEKINYELIDSAFKKICKRIEEVLDTSDNHNVFLDSKGNPKNEWRELGQEIFENGGMSAMFELAFQTQEYREMYYIGKDKMYLTIGRDLQELSACWEGIGGWRS